MIKTVRTLSAILFLVLAADAGLSSAADDRPAASPAAVDTLVICPPSLQPALAPWIEYRTAQGHRIAVAPPAETAYGMQRLVRRHAASDQLRYVVLVGPASQRPAVDAQIVPADYVRAEVNVKFGSEPLIATDITYADLADNGIPDVAIGRIPAETPHQLAAIVRKTLDYERSLDHGAWRRRVNFVAGVGGFGQLEDRVIETTARMIISSLLPAEYQTTMTHASWSSAFCPDPRQFADTTLETLNRGSLFWVYMGHGNPYSLDVLRLPDRQLPVLDTELAQQLDNRSGSPIALMLACYTAAFDAPQSSLAEVMLAQPGGPVAVFGGTRVTMPYGMSILGLGMIEEFNSRQHETLGQLWLATQRRLAEPARPDDEMRRSIDLLGRLISPTGNLLAAERREHVYLFHLLGDPLLRLYHPQLLPLQLVGEVAGGQPLGIRGVAPTDGVLHVELVYDRSRQRHPPPQRSRFDGSPAALAEYQQVYQRANDLVSGYVTMPVAAGPFEVTLNVPADTQGQCHVVAFLSGSDSHAMGSVPVEVQAAASAEPAAARR